MLCKILFAWDCEDFSTLFMIIILEVIYNKAGEISFKQVMLIQVYFRHADLWHSKTIIV